MSKNVEYQANNYSATGTALPTGEFWSPRMTLSSSYVCSRGWKKKESKRSEEEWRVDDDEQRTNRGPRISSSGRTFRLVENRKSKILRKSRPISQNSHFHSANDFGYGFSPRRFWDGFRGHFRLGENRFENEVHGTSPPLSALVRVPRCPFDSHTYPYLNYILF